MKKILLLAVIFLICEPVFTQTQISLQLINGSGTFINGLTGSNIKFKDISSVEVPGITVTQPSGNTTGNYICTGFSDFQIVTLWVNGTHQEWFGQKLAGDPRTYFGILEGDNTWSGVNTFSQPIIIANPTLSTHGLNLGTGNTLYGRLGSSNTWTGGNLFQGTTNLVLPYLDATCPWVSDVGTISSLSILDKEAGDSLYFLRSWGFMNSGVLTFNQKLRRVNQNFGHPLFDVDNSTVDFKSDGNLEVVRPVTDSIGGLKALAVRVDTTDASDNVLSKVWTLVRDKHLFKGMDSTEINFNYVRQQNGSLVSSQKFAAINNIYNEINITTVFTLDGTLTTLSGTSFSFSKPGLYDIHVEFCYEFEYSTSPDANVYDSIYVSAWHGEDDNLAAQCFKLGYSAGKGSGLQGNSTMNFQWNATTGNITDAFTIQALCSVNAAFSSIPLKRSIKGVKITATLIH